MIDLRKEPQIEMTPDQKRLMDWNKAGELLCKIISTPIHFNDWIKMSLWSVEESIALLLGRNPEVVKWNELHESIHNNVCGSDEEKTFCSGYLDLRKLVLKALDNQEIGEFNTPSYFIQWATNKGVEIPEPLQIILTDKGHCFEQWKNDYDSLKLIQTVAKEKNTIKDQITFLQQRIFEIEGVLKRLGWVDTPNDPEFYSEDVEIVREVMACMPQICKEGKSPKKQIELWVAKRRPEKSKASIRRIAQLCNPNKKGGASKTPLKESPQPSSN